MQGFLFIPLLDSLEALEGTRDQRRLIWVFAGRTSLNVSCRDLAQICFQSTFPWHVSYCFKTGTCFQ